MMNVVKIVYFIGTLLGYWPSHHVQDPYRPYFWIDAARSSCRRILMYYSDEYNNIPISSSEAKACWHK
jgi:nanoRNase/pAp phosphatase (c-di-AMP/oligoRNAs hydrolase)